MTAGSGAPSVFVCYAHKDNESSDPARRWLDRLLEHLQPLVLQNQLSAWSDQKLEIGDTWHESIQAVLQDASAAVLLVSPAFLASRYIRNSELPVLLKNAEGKGVIILPIILRECLFDETAFKYPDPVNGPGELSLATFQSANPPSKPLNRLSEGEQDGVLTSVARRLLKIVEQKRLKNTDVRKPAKHNLPPQNYFFTGREDVLNALHEALAQNKAAALTQTQAISGLGGVGKTQTANEYGYRHLDDYRAIFWVRADSHLALTSGFVEIAGLMDLPEKDAQNPDDAVRAVRLRLESDDGWLLIFDNADEPEMLKLFCPRNPAGHILLTSRAQVFDALGIARPVELEKMPPDEALKFLFNRTGRSEDDTLEREAARKIAEGLGYLPLALEQAGAFIVAKRARFQDYLTSYGKRRLELLNEAHPVTGDYPASVATTWAMNFEEVESASEAASDLLRLSAFLSPDKIPFELLTKGSEELGSAITAALGDAEDDPVAINEALVPLMRYSLIRIDEESQTYSIHRLVQEVLKDGMDEETNRLWAERAVRALNKAFSDVEYRAWPLCERILTHAKVAAKLIAEWDFAFGEAARLLNQAGHYSYERAQYAEAEPLYLRSLEIREKALGPDHPYVAQSLENYAVLLRAMKRDDEAKEMEERARAVRERHAQRNQAR